MGRELKQGDRFIAVGLVDLAVSLFTLGVPFFDSARPYNYHQKGGRKAVKFFFDEKAVNGEPLGKVITKWPDADKLAALPHPLAICKRVIWERRWLLTEINKSDLPEMQTLANSEEVAKLEVAAIAYALGFRKPDPAVMKVGASRNVIVNVDPPHWLLRYCPDFETLQGQINQGVSFIEKPENEWHPVAIANAALINISAWLDHLKTDKPYVHFTTATGKSYWVKEGSPRWSELVKLGYSPH